MHKYACVLASSITIKPVNSRTILFCELHYHPFYKMIIQQWIFKLFWNVLFIKKTDFTWTQTDNVLFWYIALEIESLFVNVPKLKLDTLKSSNRVKFYPRKKYDLLYTKCWFATTRRSYDLYLETCVHTSTGSSNIFRLAIGPNCSVCI